jgi:hypothetical protein
MLVPIIPLIKYFIIKNLLEKIVAVLTVVVLVMALRYAYYCLPDLKQHYRNLKTLQEKELLETITE